MPHLTASISTYTLQVKFMSELSQVITLNEAQTSLIKAEKYLVQAKKLMEKASIDDFHEISTTLRMFRENVRDLEALEDRILRTMKVANGQKAIAFENALDQFFNIASDLGTNIGVLNISNHVDEMLKIIPLLK